MPEQAAQHKCTSCGGAFPASWPYWLMLEQPRYPVDDYGKGGANPVRRMYVCANCAHQGNKRAPDLWEGKR